MIFDKAKWDKKMLSNCCDFYRGVVFSKKDETNPDGIPVLRSHNVDFYSNKITFNNLKYISRKIKIKDEQRLLNKDILMSVANSKEQTGKIGYSFQDTMTYAGGFMAILRSKKIILPYFLFLALLTKQSREFIAEKTQGTTSIFNITFERIKDLSIPLPSNNEQEKIISIFLSIDIIVGKLEEQEYNINDLQKILCKDLLQKEPQIGNLLNGKNCKYVTVGDIAECIEQHDKEKKNATRFIGLENIEPENLTISTWQDVSKGTTFTKKFSKGDVLFGKRRAYLKKVAVADFNGICSGDILVIRAKENIILPELLPFYIMSEPFINHAVSTSAGSLSPRTKWKDLAKLEFAIPDMQTQKTILSVFKQIQLVLTQLKKQKQSLNNLKQNLLNEIFA